MFFLPILIGIADLCFCYECSEKYRNFTENHVMCIPMNESCAAIKNIRPQKELLDYHNLIRNMSIVSGLPTATDMTLMEWDDELFEMAKRYALRCTEHPDCENCFQTEKHPVGQNFAIKQLSAKEFFNPKKQIERFKAVILEWAKEGLNYISSITNNFKMRHNMLKNWTNIFQSQTNKLGCASMHFKTPQNIYKEIYICNYAPSNYSIGQILYKRDGKPCSNCAAGYYCDIKYSQLCAKRKEIGQSFIEKRDTNNNANYDVGLDIINSESCFRNPYENIESNYCLIMDICMRVTLTKVNENKTNIIKIELKPNYTTVLMLRKRKGIVNNGCFTFYYKVHPSNPPLKIAIVTVNFPDINTDYKIALSMNKVIVTNESWNKLSKHTNWTDHRFGIAIHADNGEDIQTILMKDLVINEGSCPE